MGSLSNRPSASAFTRFFGRENELAAIEEAFRLSPIVTLAGPPGVGKTRLASEWRRRRDSRTRAEEATLFIDLSLARGSDDVVHAIASALGCAPEALALTITDRGGVTLVLDNAEGARDALAKFLADAASSTDLRALVTSRARLGVDGERVIELGGLPDDDDARSLFLDRARAIRPGIDAADPAIAELTRALEGVPLAIELAAARAVLFTPAELLDRVKRSALDTLVRNVGASDSMRARYEWSVALLAPAERAALTALSVVSGAMSVDDAEAVAGSLAPIETLREHHLLRATDDGLALYAGVRELVAESADEALIDAAFERWTTRLADRATRALSDERDAALGEIRKIDLASRSVLDTLVARGCARENDLPRATALYCALARSRKLGGPLADVLALGERLRAMAAGDVRALARITAHLGMCTAEANSARARELLEEALGLARKCGDGATERLAGLHITIVYTRIDALDEARSSVDALRGLSDEPAFLARAAHVSAAVALREGDLERAHRDIESAIVHAKRSGSSAILGRAELLGGMIGVELGLFDLAAAHLLESMKACEAVDDRGSGANAKNFLAEIRLYEGNTNEALALFSASSLDATRIGQGVIGAYTLVCRGLAHLVAGHLGLADADLAEGRELLVSFNAHADSALADAGRACIAKLRGDDVRRRAFVASALEAGIRDRAGIAALVSFADGIDRPGPHANPGPRIGAFVAERLRAGQIAERAAPTLTASSEGFAVEGQDAVSLASRPRLLALFRALVHAHDESAEAFVARARLIELTWPGERMSEGAAANRLKVALSTLRKLGLPLDSSSEGLRIAAGTRVLTRD